MYKLLDALKRKQTLRGPTYEQELRCNLLSASDHTNPDDIMAKRLQNGMDKTMEKKIF